jgi:Raf kinase inhibitor-like YbhB/YbcL family protein
MKKGIIGGALLLVALFLIWYFVPTKSFAPVHEPENSQSTSTMSIESAAFENNAPIPPTYTCDGKDVSPPLTFKNVPTEAKSLVLMMEDPDSPSGTWDHWVVYSIPPTTTVVPENSSPGSPAKNSWGKAEYGGPCPGSGEHHYVFTLYALDTTSPQYFAVPSKDNIVSSMVGHILASASLVGRYARVAPK